jgi:uncharacterized membrane protein YfcA
MPSHLRVASAPASTPSSSGLSRGSAIRLYALLGVISLILTGFVAIYALTKDPERMKFAQLIIQTTVSFAIGVVAGMLGTGSGAT